MRYFKYILKSINVLNITLIIAAAFFARYAVFPVLNTGIKFDLPIIQNAPAAVDENRVAEDNPSLSEFIMVAERNLFHPDRIMPAEKITALALPPPEIVLYGTLIMDNESYAYLEDKKASYKTPGRGKRQMVLKKGSMIGDYTLTSIEENRIELVKGENKMTVNLIDSGKPKTREALVTEGTPSMPAAASPGGQYRQTANLPASAAQPVADAGKKEITETENAATPVMPPRIRSLMKQRESARTSQAAP